MAKDIRVYLVKDGVGKETTVSNDFKELQKVIGGYIETIRIKGKLVVLCDEDGCLKRKEISALILTEKGAVSLRGDFVVCNMGSNFYSISDNDLKTIKSTVKLY